MGMRGYRSIRQMENLHRCLRDGYLHDQTPFPYIHHLVNYFLWQKAFSKPGIGELVWKMGLSALPSLSLSMHATSSVQLSSGSDVASADVLIKMKVCLPSGDLKKLIFMNVAVCLRYVLSCYRMSAYIVTPNLSWQWL